MSITVSDIVNQGYWVPIITPGDGHCLIHAVRISWEQQISSIHVPSYETIKTLIYRETIQNINSYLNFVLYDKPSLIKDLNRYIFQKHYNSPFGDLVPQIISNAFSLELNIINDINGIQNVYSITPETMGNSTLIIHRQMEHYSGIFLTKNRNTRVLTVTKSLATNLTPSVNTKALHYLHQYHHHKTALIYHPWVQQHHHQQRNLKHRPKLQSILPSKHKLHNLQLIIILK